MIKDVLKIDEAADLCIKMGALPDDLINITDAAAILRCGKAHIKNLIERGLIEFYFDETRGKYFCSRSNLLKFWEERKYINTQRN
jgi:hypothetical protein